MSQASAKPKQATKLRPNLLRTDFYDDFYFPLLLLCLSLMIITGVTVLWGLFEKTQTPANEYFPTTPDGKLMAPIPLSEAGLSTPNLLQWVVEAAINSYSFNFIDYEQAVLSAGKYYTKMGLQYYRKALLDSSLIELVTTKKYVVSATPTSAPIILREKPGPDGVYSWQVQLPMLLSLQNDKELIRQNLTLTMLVVRVPVTEANQTVAIGALIARIGRT